MATHPLSYTSPPPNHASIFFHHSFFDEASFPSSLIFFLDRALCLPFASVLPRFSSRVVPFLILAAYYVAIAPPFFLLFSDTARFTIRPTFCPSPSSKGGWPVDPDLSLFSPSLAKALPCLLPFFFTRESVNRMGRLPLDEYQRIRPGQSPPPFFFPFSGTLLIR